MKSGSSTMFVRVARLAIACALLAGCDRLQRQKDLEGSPYVRQMNDAVPRVERVAGLKFKHPPRMAIRSKSQVREYVVRQFDEAEPAQELAGKEAVYKRLGAIPDTVHLRDMLVDLLEEQVVGYYDPKMDTLYVVEGSDENVSAAVVTHELVHALQGQYVNLDSVVAQRGDDDRAGAAQAVIEGQAMYLGLLAMTDPGLINLTTNWDQARQQIREARNASPRMAAAPLIVQEELIFPYLSGADFVRRSQDKRPGKNPLLDPPRSTEQVMHAAAFFDATPDEPTSVTITTPGAAYSNTIGEFETRVLLYEQLRDQGTATRAAQGWDGDRVVLLGSGGAQALAWASVWDSPGDAGEFIDAVTQMMALRYGAAAPAPAPGAGARSFTASGRTVTVTTSEVSGRPTVLVVDAPAGTTPVTLAAVQVGANGGARR